MSHKKEKVDFVRSQEFEAVEDELASALERLEASNARISQLLDTESRGDLPFLNDPEERAAPPAAEAPPAPSTPRVRRARGPASAEPAEAAPLPEN